MLSEKDREKKRELEAQYGDDCAFFDFPGVGLTCFAPPADVAKVFWDYFRAAASRVQNEQVVLAGLATKFVVYPEQKDVAAFFARRPAAAVRAGSACRRLVGETIAQDPELDESEHAVELAKLEELRAKHDEISYYLVPGTGLIVLAAPEKAASYRQYFSDVTNDVDHERPEDVFSTFALDCVVYPARERVTELFKVKPGLAKAFAHRGSGLAGGDCQELGKG